MKSTQAHPPPDLDDLDRQYAEEAAGIGDHKPNGGKTPDTEPPALPPLIMLADCQLDTTLFWAIDDVLPRCNMMVVYARGGSGKTYLMTSVSIGIASGRWFRYSAERGAVLICAFERPQDAEDRLAALRERLSCHEAPVGLLQLAGKRLDPAVADLIIQRAKELATLTSLPVRAVVIDTISGALGGAKEDDEGLGRLRSIGERIHAETGAMVIWIHHEGKGDNMGPRGHLTLADGCAVWWHVEEHEDGSRIVYVVKANRGPSYTALFAFKLIPFHAGKDNRNKSIQLCEVQEIEISEARASPVRKNFGQASGAEKTDDKLGKNQKLLHRLFRRLLDKQPRGVDRQMLQSHFIEKIAAERKAAGKEQLSPEAAKSMFRQTLSRLKAYITEGPDDLLIPTDDDQED
jgi:AAA domain